MAGVITIGLVGGFFVLGLAVLALGVATGRQWFHLRRRSPVDVHEVREGPVEFVGRAESLEAYGTVQSGLTGERCLRYEYEVEEAQQGRYGTTWNEIASGSDGVPFAVSDETGGVLVDPDGATMVLKREYSERLEPGDDPSEAVASFLARSDVDRTDGSVDIGITEIRYGDDQRFREQRIHDGETVYVAGVADRHVGDYDVGFGGPDAVVGASPDRGQLGRFLSSPFVVSDRSEGAVQWHPLKRSLAVLAIGGATTLLAGYVLLAVVL